MIAGFTVTGILSRLKREGALSVCGGCCANLANLGGPIVKSGGRSQAGRRIRRYPRWRAEHEAERE